MDTASVRYFVHDVDSSVGFYTGHLGFEVAFRAAGGFAVLSRGPLRLLLSATGGSGGATRSATDGRRPGPGGWNRIQISVDDLDGVVDELRSAGADFRNEIVVGNGGRQVLLDDPSGNPVELFEPAAR